MASARVLLKAFVETKQRQLEYWMLIDLSPMMITSQAALNKSLLTYLPIIAPKTSDIFESPRANNYLELSYFCHHEQYIVHAFAPAPCPVPPLSFLIQRTIDLDASLKNVILWQNLKKADFSGQLLKLS